MPIENSIARAKRFLEAYRDSPDTDCESGDPIGGVVRDMLTDLAHFCDAEGIDIDERMGAAMEVFEEEHEYAAEEAEF